LKIILSFFLLSLICKIQEMVNDLGSPAMQKINNGKVQKCVDKGTKKITITKKNVSTTYDAIYKNCVEYGRQRSGNSTISIN